MNNKRWIVVGIAIVLIIVSGISSIGLMPETEEVSLDSFNPYSLILGAQEPTPEVIEEGNSEERILVLPIEGQIGLDGSGYNHESILSSIEQASVDGTIKAVLLAVDTPGGAVYHTHEVYAELLELKEQTNMPIYATMGSMAASGGYYVSMAADSIYASPHTITGSIGVIMSNFDVSGLMEDYGIKQNVIKSGEMKDLLSPTREMTDDEETVLQAYIDESFTEFLNVVEAGRPNLSRSDIENLSDGRIYSGQQALEEGLIDQVGYFKDALADLREQEGLSDAEVFQFVTNDPFSFLGGFPFGIGQSKNSEVPSLIQDLEEAQSITIEYIWEGAPSYGK